MILRINSAKTRKTWLTECVDFPMSVLIPSLPPTGPIPLSLFLMPSALSHHTPPCHNFFQVIKKKKKHNNMIYELLECDTINRTLKYLRVWKLLRSSYVSAQCVALALVIWGE